MEKARVHVVVPPKMPKVANTEPWHTHVTIDLLYNAALKTILHPGLAWMIPLSLRAVTVPWDNLSMRLSIAYAGFLTLGWMLWVFNYRSAYGLPRDVNYEEEVIVITGGASGLGKLIADFYAMRGANIAVLDVRKPDEGSMMGVAYYHCDIGDRREVQETIARVKKDMGVPSILINNAAVMHSKSILELSPDEVDSDMRVNLLSHWHTVQACLPGMLDEQRGTIVTVSSVLGYLGCLNLSTYTASKAALLAFHSSLRAELNASNDPAAEAVKTVLVTPGQLDTPMFRNLVTPSRFLAPVVPPVELAKAIVEMIDSGWSGDISLPLYAKWVPVIPALPAGVQMMLRRLSGMDRAMLNLSAAQKDS